MIVDALYEHPAVQPYNAKRVDRRCRNDLRRKGTSDGEQAMTSKLDERCNNDFPPCWLVLGNPERKILTAA